MLSNYPVQKVLATSADAQCCRIRCSSWSHTYGGRKCEGASPQLPRLSADTTSTSPYLRIMLRTTWMRAGDEPLLHVERQVEQATARGRPLCLSVLWRDTVDAQVVHSLKISPPRRASRGPARRIERHSVLPEPHEVIGDYSDESKNGLQATCSQDPKEAMRPGSEVSQAPGKSKNPLKRRAATHS